MHVSLCAYCAWVSTRFSIPHLLLERRVSSYVFLEQITTLLLFSVFETVPSLILKSWRWLYYLFSRILHFFQIKLIKRINPYKTYIRSLCFWKKVAKWPPRQPWQPYIDRTYWEKWIGTTIKGSDIQGLSIRLSRTSDQVLGVASNQQIIINLHLEPHGEQLQFIVIPVVAQSQQVNVTPNPVWLCTLSFRYQMSNFLAWERILPPPYSSRRDYSSASSNVSCYIALKF